MPMGFPRHSTSPPPAHFQDLRAGPEEARRADMRARLQLAFVESER